MHPTTEFNPYDFALTLGRIEEKVSGIVGLDERVRKLEQTVERIEAKQAPKTPVWIIFGGLGGLGGFITVLIFLINTIVVK